MMNAHSRRLRRGACVAVLAAASTASTAGLVAACASGTSGMCNDTGTCAGLDATAGQAPGDGSPANGGDAGVRGDGTTLDSGATGDSTRPAGDASGEGREVGTGDGAGVDAGTAADGSGTPIDDALRDGSAVGEGGTDVAAASADVAVEAPACDPALDPSVDPCVLDDAYGVFVSADAPGPSASAVDGGGAPTGTKDAPFGTISTALAHAGSRKRVYVCNGNYSEAVAVTSAVTLFGGLSCASGPAGRVWSYVGGSGHVTPTLPGAALTVMGVASGTVTIEDMSFAPIAATQPGASVVAALLVSSSVNLVRVTLTAGNGTTGADGATAPNYRTAAPAGAPPDVSGVAGAPGGINVCSILGTSAGGTGGISCDAVLGLGTPGTSTPIAPVIAAGRDGLPRGLVTPAGLTNTSDDPGADGAPGPGGLPATTFGMLTSAGWTPSSGGNGATGDPGQGGAGATDPRWGQCMAPFTSAGGGGGGSGGCGGGGGSGGAGGGGSIALATVASTVSLQACLISSGAGGAGGAGGTGQDAEPGGVGGDAPIDSAAAHNPGGVGGDGAGGSGGAGGTGGISVGILVFGSTVTFDDATKRVITTGAPGTAGAAGSAGRHPAGGTGPDGHPGQPGKPGMAADLLTLM
jgi:hypothetical protein